MRLSLKLPASRLFTQPFVQAQITKIIKSLLLWPLWGGIHRSIPSQRPVTRKMSPFDDIIMITCCLMAPSYLLNWDPFHEWFFHHNSNLMEILFCSHPSCNEVIAMKFCTGHDSCAVVGCAKFCSDMMSYNGVTLKPIFHPIWITMEKSFVKWFSYLDLPSASFSGIYSRMIFI